MTELDRLLRRIADGDTSPALVARARALLLVDTRLPEDLREIGLEDDDPAIAASALLGVLGLDDGLFGGLLGEALRAESGGLAAEPESEAPAPAEPDVTAAMLAAQEAEGLPPVADAVRAEAGEVAVALDVLRSLGISVIDVGAAVSALAGEVDVAAEVATRLGSLAAPLGSAVRNEAGEAEVAASVLGELGELVFPISEAVRFEAGEIDIADAVAPLAVDVATAVRSEAGEIDIAAVHGSVPEVAAAVRAESGDCDVWAGIGGAFADGWVAGLLDHELAPAAHRIAARRLMADTRAGAELAAFADQGRQIRASIREEAGETPYIWGAVAERIGIEAPEAVPGYDGSLIAEAVRETCGPVQVEAGVMARIRRTSEVVEPLATPEPANRPAAAWQYLAMVGAVAVVLMLVVGRFGGPVADLFESDPAGFGASTPDFAAAGEVNVEQLSYDEDVDVIVTLPDEDGDRPLIIRIEEEV